MVEESTASIITFIVHVTSFLNTIEELGLMRIHCAGGNPQFVEEIEHVSFVGVVIDKPFFLSERKMKYYLQEF